MAHDAQMDFVRSVKGMFPNKFEKSKVLEVGSYNINGSVRQFFNTPSTYIGLDLAPGKDVDVVCSGHEYKTDVRFDVCISSECFEHDIHWADTFRNMIHLCKTGGLVVFTCATNLRPEHGTRRTTPLDSLSSSLSDYYRNLWIPDFIALMDFNIIFVRYAFEVHGNDLYFWGVKQ